MAGVNVTTDPVWGTNVNAVVDYRFSGIRAETLLLPQWSTQERMLNPVQRSWRIAVQQYATSANTPVDALNPNTGKPYFIDFINNAAPAGGNGTVEHPFNAFNFPNGLPQADIIIVERGNSTAANPYTGSITLFNNQQLLGEGAKNVAPLPLTASFGDCTVVEQFRPCRDSSTAAATTRFVTNGGGTTPIVTLASNNQVAGFNFLRNSGGDAIFGNNINNFNLHDLQITGNARNRASPSRMPPARRRSSATSTRPASPTDNPNAGRSRQQCRRRHSADDRPGWRQQSAVDECLPEFQSAGNAAVRNLADATRQRWVAVDDTLSNVGVSGNGTGLILSETNQQLNATLNNVTANSACTNDGVDVTGTGGTVTVNSVNAAAAAFANNNGGSGLVLTLKDGRFGPIESDGHSTELNERRGWIGAVPGNTNASTTTVTITNGALNGNTRDGIHNVQDGRDRLVNLTVDPTSS